MSKADRSATPHPVTLDAPLPGFYPCLTMQLNITRYSSGGLGRMVLVVREPSDGIEVHRQFLDTTEWLAVASAAVKALESSLGLVRYLQEGDTP